MKSNLNLQLLSNRTEKVIISKNTRLLELFVRHTPAAIAMVDTNMRYLAVSDRWITDYRLKETNIIGRTHYEVFPELPERWKQDHQAVLSGRCKVLKSEEDSFVRLDGRVDWLRWELRPWRNTRGKIGGLLMFSEVITKKKLLEQKLKSSEVRMTALFEAMTDLVLTIEFTDDLIKILPTKFSDSKNASVHEEIIKQINILLFDGSEAENYQSLFRQIVQTQTTINFEHCLNIFNSTYWFSTNVSAVTKTMAIWVGHDITLRKQMEQNLFAETELAQVTLKSISDAVMTTDALGKVKYLNPVAEKLTGWQLIEAKGKPSTAILQIIDQYNKKPAVNPVDVVLQTNQTYELTKDTLLIAKDGSEYAIEDSAAPIQNRQGNLIGTVIVFRDVTQSRRLARKLTWQASHDSLTGLYNRRKFEEKVNLAIVDTHENGSHHALCYLDLDRFKIINDSCGHTAGDELLKQLTQLLKQEIRNFDIFARLGGDEFGLLFYNCSTEAAGAIAERLRQLVFDFRFTWKKKIFKLGISIGLVPINSSTKTLTQLLSTADAACYSAKEKGRNCVHFYHRNDVFVARKRVEKKWIERLNRALEKNRFCLYSQKIIDLKSDNSPHHHEILLRLIDRSGKIIAPGVFLPTAERYDLMPTIDRWVVTNFLAGYAAYCQSQQNQKIPLPSNLYTINLSGASINEREFATFLQQQFTRYDVPLETICFEITETVAISNLDNAVNLIEQLKKLGCSIALDDFGSGMSSFNYLKKLPIDYLKIDGSFVKNIAGDRVNYATVECFKYISQIMNLKTIAEFVEDNLILQNLRQIGIDYAQGYGIERPQPLVFK